jgi:hypothetical protein
MYSSLDLDHVPFAGGCLLHAVNSHVHLKYEKYAKEEKKKE